MTSSYPGGLFLWPSNLNNGISYTAKKTSVYWIRALVIIVDSIMDSEHKLWVHGSFSASMDALCFLAIIVDGIMYSGHGKRKTLPGHPFVDPTAQGHPFINTGQFIMQAVLTSCYRYKWQVLCQVFNHLVYSISHEICTWFCCDLVWFVWRISLSRAVCFMLL